MFPLRDSKSANIFPFITFGLIALNAYVFFLEISAGDPELFITKYALIPRKVDFDNLLSLTPFVTSQFLHIGFLHILSNMWFLKIFGDNVEEKFGGAYYLFVYLLSGVVGGVLQYLFLPASAIPMLGASGAVAGILGAYLVFFPNHTIETLIPFGFFVTTANISAHFMLLYWFITQLFSGVGSVAVAQMGGVAFWAHIGGFVTGYLFAKFFRRPSSSERDLFDI